MKTPGLHTSLGQQITLSPQLRQSLALLQMSALELEQELTAAVETNPLLDWTPAESALADEAVATPAETTFTEQLAPADAAPEPALDEAEFPDLSPWESAPPTPGSVLPGDESADDIGQRTAASESLHEHLEWQLRLARLSPREQLIGEALIDAIDDDGYLREPFSAIKTAVHPEITALDHEIGTVLARIQCFDPPGVGARDLAECLILQLDTLPADRYPRARALARRVAGELLDRLPRLGTSGLAGELGCSPAEAEQALTLLRSLDPHPGAQIGAVTHSQYLTPDCIITRAGSGWRVALAGGRHTRLSIHHAYEQMIGHTSDEDGHYLRRHLLEARALLKNLQARSHTLLKVVGCLAGRQSEFLHHGPAALRPLTLREVADEIGLHESTVSRAIAHKYVQTPRGTLALRDFFASRIEHRDGNGISSTAISQMIRELIATEPPHKPLSDTRLTRCLNERGIPVARRTVAKYREALSIPASHQRVRLV